MKDYKTRLPWLGEKLLNLIVPDHLLIFVIGDFEEFLAEKELQRGKGASKVLFWYQLIIAMPVFIFQSIRFRVLIFKHSIQVAGRHLKRHFSESMLNLAGLSIGVAGFLIILIYVQDELSYDTFHSKSDRIYRVLDFRKVNGIGEESASAPIPLAESMLIDYPEQIESAVRFFNFQAPTLALSTQTDTDEVRQFNESGLYFVDHGFFDVFDFKLLQGNPATALHGPNKIVLSSAMAEKYFDQQNPLGKILRFEGKHDFVVSGVLDSFPDNTHLTFDFLVSFESLDNPEILRKRLRTGWIWNPCWTYVLLKPEMSAQDLEAHFSSFVNKYFPESRRERVKLYLQPIKDIHLYSNLDYEMSPNSQIIYIKVFAATAVFILLISCINFINLVTARASRRYGEIGIRKILGSNRRQLIWQLMHESFFLSFLAMLLAIGLVWLALPLVNGLTSKQLIFDPLADLSKLKWLVFTFVTVGVLSGIYPAFSISLVRPVQVIKGRFTSIDSSGGALLRKCLVVGQFGLSMLLIVGTIVALMQFNYLQKRTLGFQPEQVVLLPILRSPIMDRYETFKGTLLQNSNISSVTTVEDVPGMRHQTGGYRTQEGTEQQFPRLIVHDDFAKTMGIEMAAGRDFSASYPSDASEGVVINEAMVRQLQWASPEEALGKSFNGEQVVGVVKDFHFSSLHHPIGPFVLERVFDDARSLAFSARYLAIRIETKEINNTLSFIEAHWSALAPNTPFEYKFLGGMLAQQYEAESKLSQLVAVFCTLSLLIACMGLYGLASFSARQRLKEVGIRKVMGASISNLVWMLSASFLKLILFSMFLSWPVAYLMLNKWLEGFAYRIAIDSWPFLISGVLGFMVVFFTVSFQALKASMANPVHILRNE